MEFRVTLSDIAQEVGLHTSTVCMALKNYSGIAERTRKRVLDAAERLGYRPDPALSQIAADRWRRNGKQKSLHNLAYLVNTISLPWPGDYLNLQLKYFRHAKKRAEELGYHLEVFKLEDYETPKAASRVLRARGVRGLLVPPVYDLNNMFASGLEWDQFSSVCCAAGCERPPLHSVSDDPFAATTMACRKVQQRGYRRVGGALFVHNPLSEHDLLRHGAFFAYQDRVPARNRIPILKCDFADRAAFLEWFDRHEPDAVVAFSEEPFQWLLDHGVRAPEDVGYASLHVRPEQFARISGIHTMHESIGRAAVDVLIEQIRCGQRGFPDQDRILLLEPSWNEGTSLAYPEVAASVEPSVAAR